MTDSHTEQASRLAGSRSPIAIVHEGFFVYANAAFLQQLGYRSFEDLEAVPLLDAVESRDHERLREHLDAAKRTAGTERRRPEARLTFRRADDLPLGSECTSFHTRYGGEDCIQITLKSRSAENLGQWFANLPWRLYLSIAFLALFTVLPSLLLLKLNIDNAPSVYFPDDEPAVVIDRELQTRFPDDEVFFLVFSGVAPFSEGFFEAYDQLTATLLDLPSVDDVISLTTQDHIRSVDDSLSIERLIDVDELPEHGRDWRRDRIVSDRFARDTLISKDQSSLGMIVVPGDSNNSLERLQLESDLHEAIESAGLNGYLKAVAGWVPVDVAELRSMLNDNSVFIPATVVTGLLLVWWLFRRWLAVMMAGIAMSVVVNSTVALYVILNQPFNLISSIISPMLSALTVAALVHLFNALYQASQRGYVGRERVRRALQEVDRPARFAALTTAAGLASLASSPIVPIKIFGLIAAVGVGFIYLVVYRVLPNVFGRWDKKSWPRVTGGLNSLDSTVRGLTHLGMRHPVAVVCIVTALLAVGAPQLHKVVVETNFQRYFQADHPVRQATEFVDDNFVGTMPLEVVFNVPMRDGLVDYELLSKIRDFQHWVVTLPEVDRSFSMVDFIEELHWAFRGEQEEFRSLPTDNQLISQLLLIYDGDDLYDFVDRDLQHSHVTLNLNEHSANGIANIIEKIRDYLETEVGDSMEWDLAGAGRLFADMEELLVVGQVYSLWGALVLIFVLMLVLWRSPWDAALCMIPNLSPILLIFIAMGALGIWLDMATAMIASVAVGIAVDDTIHVYHGFRHRISRGVSPLIAMARGYREAGRAVVVTTIILSAQFLILVTSDFVPTRNFGLLTTVGLVAALLFDLLLLPALLMIFYGDRSPVADFIGRLRGGRAEQIAAEIDDDDPSVDEVYWTPDRKLALVKEVLSGKASVATAAREYALPETEIDKWLQDAEQGISEVFGGRPTSPRRDPAKVRALARAYKRLQDENRELRDKLDEA